MNIAYINNMGGSVSGSCDASAKPISGLCIHEQVWISAEHTPESNNVLDDSCE